MNEIKAVHILSPYNNMNIYRGCTHGCIYCDSRSKCYRINHDFEDVAIKKNALELLEKELSSKRKKVMISTGSMSDPYVHLEKEMKYTGKALEIIAKYGHGISILTKSTMIVRDLDLYKKINEKAKVVVSMTFTTFDDQLSKIVEPHVATTKERCEALKIFSENGIKTGVWLGPFLPFINDTKENFTAILNLCLEAKVEYILCFGIGMTLREGNREYYYRCLDRFFPGLKERYIEIYQDKYEVSSPNSKMLYAIFERFCQKHNILYKIDDVFQYLRKFEGKEKIRQLTLF